MSAPTSLPQIGPSSTLREVLEAYPGAQRALFARYHIGGCSSCSFDPQETLSELCARNEAIPVDEMIAHIQESHDADEQILVEPLDLKEALAGDQPPTLLDIRTREEHEAVAIPGSQLFSNELTEEIFSTWEKDRSIVVYDHTGQRCLDATAYLRGHGYSEARALRGGIDAYARDADSSIGRYRIEFDED